MVVVKKVRDHIMEFENDIVFVRLVGDETESDAKEFTALQDEFFGLNPFYVILDSHQVGTVEPGARRIFTQWVSRKNFRGSAAYGATLATRTLGTLTLSAIRLISGKIIPMVFVKSHDEAVAWIAEQRIKHQTLK
jgi:hypothetical protein